MRKRNSVLFAVVVLIVAGLFQRSYAVQIVPEDSTLTTINSVVTISDIGVDYSDTMTVGETQTLSPYVLPSDEIVQFTYSSNDKRVASVDVFGKITAHAAGSVTIAIRGGNVTKEIVITVVAPKVVTSIEVSDFNNKMKKGETQPLSTTLYPTEAEDQTITYTSSNENVATISSGGTITALNKGNTTITLTAGTAKKTLELSVYVPTEKFQVSSSYVVLTPGETQRLSVSISPSDANQSVSYRSLNSKIATAGSNGTITARAVGETSIIISNDDLMKAVTVIVNAGNNSTMPTQNQLSETETPAEDENSSTQGLSEIIADAEGADEITVTYDECMYLTTDVLKWLYQNRKTLVVTAEDYIIRLQGNHIKNAENGLSTLVTFREDDLGLHFIVNEKKSLPGAIEIEFLKVSSDFKYVYLYNESGQKYQKLKVASEHTVKIHTAGEYVFTCSPIKATAVPIYIIISSGVVTLAGIGIYIYTKKKYWFW